MHWRSKPRTRSSAAGFVAGGLALVTLLAPVPGSEARAASERFVVVVSADVSLESVTPDELRRLFQFRRKFWKPGSPVTILYSEEALEDNSFLLQYVYRSDYPALKRLILEKLYQGEIDLAPKVVGSDELAVAFVASGRGLLALVREEAAAGRDLRVLAVGGLRPGDRGYPLQR